MASRKAIIICSVIVIVIAISIGLLASSFERLSSEQAGIQYDIHLHKLGKRVYEAGLHTGPPGFNFIIFPKVYRTISFGNIKCLNKDGLTIELDVQFQYLVDLTKLRSIILEFKDHDTYTNVLRNVASSAIHDTCSKFNVTQFQTSREDFQDEIRKTISMRFEVFRSSVADVQVSNIDRPKAYEVVIRQKEAAKQNIKIAENERPRILTEAKTKKLEAETQARITIRDAETNARITKTKAKSTADGILNAYKTEANTYKEIMKKQGLDVEGLLAYLATRAIQSAKKPVYIGMDPPAKTKYP